MNYSVKNNERNIAIIVFNRFKNKIEYLITSYDN